MEDKDEIEQYLASFVLVPVYAEIERYKYCNGCDNFQQLGVVDWVILGLATLKPVKWEAS